MSFNYIQIQQAKKELQNNIKHIPKKNRFKFYCDLLKLIEHAKKENYENYYFE